MAVNSIDEQLTIVIRAKADEAKRAFEDLKRKMDDLKDSAGRVGTGYTALTRDSQLLLPPTDGLRRSYTDLSSILPVFTAGLTAASLVLRQGLADAEAERQGLVRLQAVIESTGRSSEISAGQIDEMTQRLEDAAYQDKQAAMDAMARLATYDSISSDLFGRILTASSDISAAFKTDIGSAISDMGRTLEDPISGLTRLRRQGIMISSEIEDQIASLIEQNRLYDAQVLILDEIEAKVGGVAEKIAEVSSIQELSAMWGKFVGEVGNTFSGSTSPFLDTAADILNKLTGILEEYNLGKTVSGITLSDALAMDTADLTDYLAKLEEFMTIDWMDGLPGAGNMTNYYVQLLAEQEDWIGKIQEELEKRQQVSDAEAEALKIEERRKKEQEERLSLLESEKGKTAELSALYAATDEGQVWSLENQMDELDQMWRSDMLSLSRAMSAGDDELVKIINERIVMYGAIREDLARQLSDLTNPDSDGGTDDSAAELAIAAEEEKLKLLSEEELMQKRLAEYQGQLDEYLEAKLINQEEYNRLLEIEKDTLGFNNDEKEKAAELEKLTAQAEEEKLKLLSDEEKARRQSIEYQQLLNTLFEAGLISQDDFNQLLSQQNELLGLCGDEISSWQASMNAVKSEWDSFLQNSLSYRTVAGQISSALSAVGEAWASNEDAGAAALQSFEQFSRQIINEMTNMLITAGLRCIIEGNIPVGLALLAAGGMTGIMGGALFGSSRAVSDSMMSMMENQIASMEREAEAREKLVNAINDSIDTEFELLRRQLDRNLISEDEFIAGAGELQAEREEAQHTLDVANARTAMANAIYSKIASLDTEYSQMSGWDKLWSGRDNDIKDEINDLESYLNKIQSATEDELRNILDALVRMGVSTSGVPAFAEGGEFFTRGAQLIKVGDNASGIEHVKITPLNSMSEYGSRENSPSIVIYITGDVYGIEDLYGKLERAGLKLGRRMR